MDFVYLFIVIKYFLRIIYNKFHHIKYKPNNVIKIAKLVDFNPSCAIIAGFKNTADFNT